MIDYEVSVIEHAPPPPTSLHGCGERVEFSPRWAVVGHLSNRHLPAYPRHWGGVGRGPLPSGTRARCAANRSWPCPVKLRTAKSGANVEIIEPDDTAILRKRVENPGAPPVSSPVQTYLDLWHLDHRGREAADHLREKLLTWR